MRPVKDTVLGIVCWELLPKRCKEIHRTLGPQHGYDPEALTYVLYRASNRKQMDATPVNVFSHTRYITNADMLRCYGLRGKRPAT